MRGNTNFRIGNAVKEIPGVATALRQWMNGLKMPLTEFKSARQPYARSRCLWGFSKATSPLITQASLHLSAVSRGTFAQPGAGRGLSAVCHLGLRLEMSRGRHASTHLHQAPDCHMAWLCTHSSLWRSWAASQEFVSEHRLDAALEPYKGKPSRSVPPGKRSLPVSLVICLFHTTFSRAHSTPGLWAPDKCQSVSKKALCLPGSHRH